jgi:hypothetical protein
MLLPSWAAAADPFTHAITARGVVHAAGRVHAHDRPCGVAAVGCLTSGVGAGHNLGNLLCDLCLAGLVELHQQHLRTTATT